MLIFFIHIVCNAYGAGRILNLRHQHGHAESDFGNNQNKMDLKRARNLLESGEQNNSCT